MSEFVLIIPLIGVVMGLLFYIGGLMLRAQHMTALPRYEAWRTVDQAPGPAGDELIGNPLLNQAFFNGNATVLRRPDWSLESGAYFPEDPYIAFIEAARQSRDGGEWAEHWIYRPGGGSGGGVNYEPYRLDAGRRRVYEAGHLDAFNRWERLISVSRAPIENPENTLLTRQHVRIGNDWSYTNDFRASAPQWADARNGEIGLGHLRSLRDAFFPDVDAAFDNIDGDHLPEYSDHPGGPQNPDTSTLAGMIRSLWLQPFDYRGPEVP